MTGILPGGAGPATTPAEPTEPPLVDRAHLLAEIRAALTATGGVLLHGPAGIGKTALLDTLARDAERAGETVLRSSPTAAEADLPHLALIDLLGEALPGLAEDLPDHLRQALERALLHRAPAPGTATDPLAVRVAVLEALRRLAQRGPVLVLLDDTQWLDEASRQVIAFAARRLTDRQVRFAVTERTEGVEQAGTAPEMVALCPPAAREIPVGPLGERGTGALLRERLDLRLSGLTLTRVHAVSGGNPYYALELGRSLAADGSESALAADPARPLDVPHRLRALVAARLGELPDPARQSLTVLAAARPGTALPDTVTEPLGAARRHGIVRPVPAGTPRPDHPQFSHPLVAEVVLAAADPAELRAAHRLLADLTDDPVEQVRHQALAADAADPDLADRLAAAADTALTRGAPGTAAELLRLAADHTPDPDTAGRHLLAAARNATAAGLPDLARACGERLATAPAADVRVHARLLLARLLGPDHPGAEPLLTAAAEDTGGHPALTAAVHQERAVRALHRGDRAEGLAELATAEKHADLADDPDLLVELLAQRAPLTLLTDPALGLAQLERGCRLAAGRPATAAAVFCREGLAVAALRSGDLPRAVAEVEALRAEVEAAGRTEDLANVLYITASVYERAGRCTEAYAAGRAAHDLRERIEPSPGPARVLGGAAELNGGTAERAAQLLDSAIRAAEDDHDREWLSYAHGLRGRVELLRGNHQAAAEHLGRCLHLLRRMEFTDPAFFLVDADLAEALALSGRPEEAAATLADARERATGLGRDVLTLGLHRAEAHLTAAADPRRAADTLRELIPDSHPYPLELARAHLALGTLERRARRRAAARAALQEAHTRYAAAGCLPWQQHTAAALAALDALEADPTPMQQQILALIRAGATNREIAARLHLSVKAVEANLTRLYRQYGVRGRAELARHRD
ncbi:MULTISPECIES: LuxR family transcriptional regulator [Kitasatospora]|uniref:Putative LuxR family transcriptional regulator n=1 Tax=Kitasatospora setae (strain ATCC 33774 / DSM 43861 / JCM 3304 / KCC A-0304 / NBRC 14216 / KM-6054) TaxID=452652 RepID=E4NJ00_KITSK|nr:MULTISPECIES: LuxR family transcriptional regulator [Kitasatospora]BAJ32948.1 putative LuxR family transcriptional regulator [Kitasatospora setae KM-6054]